MTILKTRYTPDQIAEHLYFLCIRDKETNSSIQFYKEENRIEQIDPKVETELRFHIYVLKLFTCIYTVPFWSGNSQKQDEIIHSFSKIIASSMMIQPNNDSMKSVTEEFDAYQNAIIGKTGDEDELVFAIGKCFAIIMGKSDLVSSPAELSSFTVDTASLMSVGTNIFVDLFISIKDWLKNIK